MTQEQFLTDDILLCSRSVQTRTAHLLIRTVYHARTHTVTHITRGARHRLWGLLPPRDLPRTEEEIAVPYDVRTESALLRFLRNEQPLWL